MSATATAAPATPPTIPGQLPQGQADFLYWDGCKSVHADCLALYRQLLIRTRGKPNELTDRIYAVDPSKATIEQLTDSWEAAEQLDALVRDLFKMQPFNPSTGQGASVEVCWAVWNAFCEVMATAKKKRESLPTPSTLSDGPTASSQPANSTSA